MPLTEKIEVIVRRRANDYFVGWTGPQLADLHPDIRPTGRGRTKEKPTGVSYNERLLDRKLAWAWADGSPDAKSFQRKVRRGELTAITEAKQEAATVWRDNSDDYDGRRNTHEPGDIANPRGVKRLQRRGEAVRWQGHR